MINSIELHNWKTHKDTKLNFTKGTNVLVGLMGAGKSSIMDAISYALFGTFPSIQHRRVGVSELITSRPNQESEASVKIAFTLDGNSYTVERNISIDEGAKATLEKNGAYLQSQPQRVTEEIERILKVDYDLFSRAIYSEQNRIDYFLELRAADRKGQIDELLGLDKFAMAQENATSLVNRIKDTIAETEKAVASFDSQKTGRELSQLNEELAELSKKKASLEKEATEAAKELKSTDANLKAAKDLLAKKIRVAKEVAEVKSKVEVVKGEIKKLDGQKLPQKSELDREVSEANKQLLGIRAKEQQSRDEERSSNRELSDIEAQIKHSKQRIIERDKLQSDQKDRKIDAEEKKLSDASDGLSQLQKELATYQSQKEETKKWVSELEKHITTCPVCERDLDKDMKAKLLETKKSALSNAEHKIGSSDMAIREKKSEIDKLTKALDSLRLLNSKLKDYVGLDSQLKELEAKLSGAKERYDRAKLLTEEAKKEYDKITARISELTATTEKVNRLESYKKQITELEKEASSKESELGSINVEDATVEKLQGAFTSISSRSSRIASEVDAHKRYIDDKQKLIEEKDEQMKRISKLVAEVAEKKAAIENLVKFKNALEETQRQMRTRLIGSINNVMSTIWPDLYPYGDYTGIILEPSASDYVLKVRTLNGAKEKWEEVQGIASGGERSIACLAMRVAFALVLVPNLRWMILDEPTHNIDEQGMARFIRVFNETLPKIIDQIFIITHEEALKQASSAKTYILTRNKGEGGATAVQEQ